MRKEEEFLSTSIPRNLSNVSESKEQITFFFFFSIWLDIPHLTNEHRTQDCIAN